MIDDIRARYPHLGIAVYAMEPDQPVTLETFAPDGTVFSFVAGSVADCVAKAFPELTEIDMPPREAPPMEAAPTEPTSTVFD